MARSLRNKPNVEVPTARYPEGRIKDDDGSGNGTPVNEDVYGDFHQFFARLLVEAGITPNEIAENAYDGFQYIQALKTLISPESWNNITSLSAGWSQMSTSQFSQLAFKKIANNGFAIKGAIAHTSTSGSAGTGIQICTMPIEMQNSMPSIFMTAPCVAYDGSNLAIDGFLTLNNYLTPTIQFTPSQALSSQTINLFLDGIVFYY